MREDNRLDFQRFFDDDGTADVILMLRDDDIIDAHRILLAFVSEHFDNKLADSDYMGEKEYRVPRRDVDTLTTVIKYIYGFEAEDCVDDMPESLFELAEIGATAEDYGVPGLIKWASDTADDLLAACLSDEAKLGEFLTFDCFHLKGSSKNVLVYDYAVEFIRKNLKKLNNKTAFHKLVENEPRLARKLPEF